MPDFSELEGLLLRKEVMKSLEDKDTEEILYTNFKRTPVRGNFNRGRLPGRYPRGRSRGYHVPPERARLVTIQVGRKRSSRKCGNLGHFIREDDIIEMEHEMKDLQTQLFEMHAEETAHIVDDCIEEDESEEAAVNPCMEAFRIIVVGSESLYITLSRVIMTTKVNVIFCQTILK